MIRSLRGGAALVVLALAGLTWGQSGSPTGSPGRAYTISVQEPGKPSQVCKILKVWNEANGLRGYQVEALDTGERMTVLETSPITSDASTTAARTVSTRVFRYGKSTTPPPGVPAPPQNALSLESLPITPVSPYAVAAGGNKTVSTSLKPTESIPGPTAPISGPTASVATPALLPPTPVSRPTATSIPTAPTVTEKSADWRQSWGRLDQVRVEEQPPRISGPEQVKVVADQVNRGMNKMPVARQDSADPLKQPAAYSKTPAKIERDITLPAQPPARLAVSGPASPSLTSLAPVNPPPTVKAAGLGKLPTVMGQTIAPPLATPVVSNKPLAPAPSVPASTGAANPTTTAKTGTPTAACTTCAICAPCNTCTTCPNPAATAAGPLRPIPATGTIPAANSVACQSCPTTPAGSVTTRLTPTPPPPTVVTQPAKPTPTVSTVSVVEQPKKPAPTPAPVVEKPKTLIPVSVPVVAQPSKQTLAPAPVVEQPKKLTPTPLPVVEQPKKAVSPPTPVVEQPQKQPEATKSAGTGSWNPFARPAPPRGMASIAAAASRELREDPQPIVVDRPMGGPLSVTPPANAFVEPVVRPQLVDGNAFTQPPGYQPIPMDRVRKDLMPPELVAMLEGKGRPGKNPLPAGMEPPLPFTPPQSQVMAPVPQQPVILPPQPAPIQRVAVNPALEQHRQVLREALLPSDREIAAEQLASFEPQRVPLAVTSLLTGATSDPAVTVRVACIRALGKMRAGTSEVVSTLAALERDPDQRIRIAAVEVRALLQSR